MSPGALNWYKQFKVKTSSKWISNFKVSVTKAIYFLLSQAAVFFRLNLSGPRGNRVNSGIIVRGPGKTKSSSAFAFFTDTQSTRAGHRHSVNRQFKLFYMCLNGGRQHQWRFLKQRVRVHPHNCWYVLERGSRACRGRCPVCDCDLWPLLGKEKNNPSGESVDIQQFWGQRGPQQL